MEAGLVIVGLGYTTEPLRERYCMSAQRRQSALQELVKLEGIDEAAILISNARTELVIWGWDPSLAADSSLRFLHRRHKLSLDDWGQFYRLLDAQAILHLARLAALDPSPSDDEGACLSEARTTAQQAGTMGPYLKAIFDRLLRGNGAVPDMDYSEASTFLKVLRGKIGVPPLSVIRRVVSQACVEEIENLREQIGPFQSEQEKALSALTANVAHHVAADLSLVLKQLSQSEEKRFMAAVQQAILENSKRTTASAD